MLKAEFSHSPEKRTLKNHFVPKVALHHPSHTCVAGITVTLQLSVSIAPWLKSVFRFPDVCILVAACAHCIVIVLFHEINIEIEKH